MKFVKRCSPKVKGIRKITNSRGIGLTINKANKNAKTRNVIWSRTGAGDPRFKFKRRLMKDPTRSPVKAPKEINRPNIGLYERSIRP
jgi:hypothetical protein